MSECRHDWRAVGGPIDGAPPANEKQHAWCRLCGALHTTSLLGWGELVPMRANTGRTLADVMLQAEGVTEALRCLGEVRQFGALDGKTVDALDLDVVRDAIAGAIAALEGRRP